VFATRTQICNLFGCSWHMLVDDTHLHNPTHTDMALVSCWDVSLAKCIGFVLRDGTGDKRP